MAQYDDVWVCWGRERWERVRDRTRVRERDGTEEVRESENQVERDGETLATIGREQERGEIANESEGERVQ